MAWRKSLLGVIVASSVFAFVPTASAHSTHLFSKSFAGAGDSQLSSPEGLAVDQASNDVYVGDPANARVEKFDSSGNFILMFGEGVNKTKDEEAGSTEVEQNVCTAESGDVCQAGTPASSPGGFTAPRFVAVDSSTGDVYVADTGTGLVQKFNSSGVLISSWGSHGQLSGTGLNSEPDFVHLLGIGVDSSGVLHVYNANTYNDGIVSEFESGGNYIISFGAGYFPQAIGIAVASNGDTYLGGGTKFSPTGSELGLIARLESPTGLAVDPSNGDFFVDRRGEAIDLYVENCGNPRLEDDQCESADTFGEGQLTSATSIAVDASSDTVYVAEPGAGEVSVFVAATTPDVTTGYYSKLTKTTATVAGEVDPAGGGEVTECYFEYSERFSNTSLGKVPCAPPAPYPGSTPTNVTAELTGLEAESMYGYWLVATDASGKTVGKKFILETSGPIRGLQSLPPTEVLPTSARFNGTLNPAGLDTKYYFEYYDQIELCEPAGGGPGVERCADEFERSEIKSAPLSPVDAGSGNSEQEVSATLTDLEPNKEYFYRIVASNELGTARGPARSGNDFRVGEWEEFTTPPPPPRISGVGVTNVHTDGATVKAEVDSGYTTTKYHFEYGVEDCAVSSCSTTPDEEVGKHHKERGVSDTQYRASALLTGLQPDTIYHYRLVAENSTETVRSADRTFKTFPPNQGEIGGCPNGDARHQTGAELLPDCRAYELVSAAN